MTGDQVRYLITAKLLPLGIVADQEAPAHLPTASPLLALTARGTLLPERAASAAGTLLRPLFRPPVIAAVTASVAAVDYWLFAAHGLGSGLQQILRDPVGLLAVFALTLVSAAFHECGHAAGCRYGRRPTRCDRRRDLPAVALVLHQRHRLLPAQPAGLLRTDLGGLYFNLIFILALACIYSVSSAGILLVVIAVTHLEMMEQLLPFIRFDGYFVLSDLTGVPDLFARVVPIIRSVGPKGPRIHAWPACGPAPGSRSPAGCCASSRCSWPAWVPPAAPPRDQPGAMAGRDQAGAPHVGGGRRPPLRDGRGRRDRRGPAGPVGGRRRSTS